LTDKSRGSNLHTRDLDCKKCRFHRSLISACWQTLGQFERRSVNVRCFADRDHPHAAADGAVLIQARSTSATLHA
jgi:hypothetical protein